RPAGGPAAAAGGRPIFRGGRRLTSVMSSSLEASARGSTRGLESKMAPKPDGFSAIRRGGVHVDPPRPIELQSTCHALGRVDVTRRFSRHINDFPSIANVPTRRLVCPLPGHPPSHLLIRRAEVGSPSERS